RSLEEDRPRNRPRISLGQAGRSELPGPDLRQPGRSRGWQRSQPHLVPTQRRLRPAPEEAPPRRGFFMLMSATVKEKRIGRPRLPIGSRARPPLWPGDLLGG